MKLQLSPRLFPTLAGITLALAVHGSTAWAGGYMKIGDIEGESTDKAHPQWVVIDSLRITPQRRENARPAMTRGDKGPEAAQAETQPEQQAEAAATASAGSEPEAPAEVARHEPLVVVRKTDASSGQLEQAFKDSSRFTTVAISMPDGSRPGKYLHYDLTDVVIADYSRAAGSAAVETLALSYGGIAVVAQSRPSRKALDLKQQEELEAQAEAAASADSQKAKGNADESGSAATESGDAEQ